MAEGGKISVNINFSARNEEDAVVPENINMNKLKSLDTNWEQHDSRATNPDGAQSPASSIYAECEETDTLIIDNSSDILSKVDSTEVRQSEPLETSAEQNCVDGLTSTVVNSQVDVDEVLKSIDSENNGPTLSSSAEVNVKADCDLDIEFTIETTQIEEAEISDGLEEFDVSGDDIYEIDDLSAEEALSHSDEHEENRENGDGEEINEDEAAQKKLDDDEDRRNPQYIPKRGFYYEHDVRTAGTGSEDETSDKKQAEVLELDVKRRGRRNVPNGRWQHDKYKEEDQKAKSTQELIAIYGYDIRNEESAPKVRRRRKYGRGPNRYTRKWDDEDAYARELGKSSRPSNRQKSLPVKREEYNAEFPGIAERKARSNIVRSRERHKVMHYSKPTHYQETSRSDYVTKCVDDHRQSPLSQKFKNDYSERPSRHFAKRAGFLDPVVKPSEKSIRAKFIVNTAGIRGSGRGISHGRRRQYLNHNYDASEIRPLQEDKLPFYATNRDRAKRLDYVSSQTFSKKSANDDINDLTERIANADLKPNRSFLSRVEGERKTVSDQVQEPSTISVSSTLRSKRYSQQRHRQLPESNIEKGTPTGDTHVLNNVLPISRNMIEKNGDKVLCQPTAATRKSMPLLNQNQLSNPLPPQNVTPLTAHATSVPSNSLPVSASLISPHMTASATSLQAAAPTLPIMGFFQHPQGFANQGTAAQLYTREQNVITGPSNQPVQLLAFLPATPLISNNSCTQAVPPPTPPPPPVTYPTSVINYPRPSPSLQTQPTFTSETYSMPSVTLAPIHQPPDMYQSRSGVTYYNTQSQVNSRSPPPPRVKAAIPIIPPPGEAK